MSRVKTMVLLGALCASQPLLSITNISLFGGDDYATGPKHATKLQLSNAAQWQYGDNFFYFDVTNPHKNTTSIYGEWHSRLSASKISGKAIHWGPISDVLLAGELNFGGNNTRAYLLGVGFNFDAPKMNFLKLNIYSRRDPSQPGSTYQITPVWSATFNSNERTSFLFDGFIDYAGSQGTLASNFLTKPRLMLDIGKLFHGKAKRLYAGIRYVYWHNKLGTKGTTESLPEWMITWSIH